MDRQQLVRTRWRWVAGRLGLLMPALLHSFTTHAQLVVGATGFGPPRHVGADTTALLALRTRRVGANTYVQTSDLRGYRALGARQQVRYRLGSDWIYDDRGNPPFVREDYRADLAHVISLDHNHHWLLGQQLHYDQSRANVTRTGLWLGRLGYQGLLRRGDTLSVLRLTALAGLATDTRNGHHDQGAAYGVDALVGWFPQGPTVAPLTLRVLGTRAHLGPRTVQRLVTEASGESTWLEDAALRVQAQAGYRQNRAEDYLGQSVQRIQSDTLAAQLSGQYRITPFATLRSDNTVLLPTRAFLYRRQSSTADTLQDLGYRQQEFDTRQELRLTQPKLQGGFAFLFHERNRAYYLENSRFLSETRLATALAREQVKDITEQTTRYQADLTWLPVVRHSFTAMGSAQLLRVNAPSKDNQQTRDEAQHLLRLTWAGRWAGDFRTTLGLAGEIRQTVFIKAAQSAENYVDHLLHWEPGFTWAPGRFSIRSNYHLWVSYQVRDRVSEQARNRASRVLEQTQNLSFQLRPCLLLMADYVRRENRVGQLQWSAFKESPLDTTIIHDLTAGLRQQWAGRGGSTSLRLSYRLLEQRSYGRALLLPEANAGASAGTGLYLHRITRQHGPEVAAERHVARRLDLAARLWLQWLHTYNTSRAASTVFTTAPSFLALDLTAEQRRLLPYFEVNVLWRVGR